MSPLRSTNPASPVSRVAERDREHEIGCNYRGRLDFIRTLIDQAEYSKALYELNQLAGFIRPLKQMQEQEQA